MGYLAFLVTIFLSALLATNPCKDSKCEQICYKLDDGTSACECDQGYQLRDDKATCEGKLPQMSFSDSLDSEVRIVYPHFRIVDIDECQGGNHGCNQICENGQGNYTCKCRPGFGLQADLRTCEGEIFNSWMRSNERVIVETCTLGRSYVNSANRAGVALHTYMEVTLKACEEFTQGARHLKEIKGFIAYRLLCSNVQWMFFCQHVNSNFWYGSAGKLGNANRTFVIVNYNLQLLPESNYATLGEKRLPTTAK